MSESEAIQENLSDERAQCTEVESSSLISGISKKHLDKFIELRKRRMAQSHRSTAKRIDEVKSALADKIKSEFSNDDELAALQTNDVDIARLCSKDKRCTKSGTNVTVTNCVSPENSPAPQANSRWTEVKPYLGINDHLSDETGGSSAPKSRLELAINEAVAMQEYDVAEQLSNRLATRDFGVKIAEAIDAKQFTEKRKREAAAKAATKKKRLAWGFEPKHRWETKGNM